MTTTTAPAAPSEPAGATATSPTPEPTESTTAPSPTPTQSLTPPPSPTPTPSSIPTASSAADYFEAVNDQQPVEGLAVPDSPAYAYGTYLELYRIADLGAGLSASPSGELEEVDGGFDLIPDESIENQDPILIRDIETNDDGLVETFTRNGTPIGEQMFRSGPTEGDGLQTGEVYALSNEGAIIVVLDITNTSDEVASVSEASFVQGGRQSESDGSLSVSAFDLGSGNTTTVSFVSLALAQAAREPIDMTVTGYLDESFDPVTVEMTLEPIG